MLLENANSLLSELKSSGELDKIIQKYFNNDTSTFKTQASGIIDASKNQLVVATHTPFSPFEYVIGNRYCGIDIEIAGLLAQKMDKELVIKEFKFEDIFTAVANGDADIVMAGLSIVDSRTDIIDYTDTYFEASQLIIARKYDNTFNECKTTEDVVEILSRMNKTTSIGYQINTISEAYVKGDIKQGFNGYMVNAVGFPSAQDAVKALMNGEINYVILDEAPAKIIVAEFNK